MSASQNEKKHLSISQLNMLSKCGEQYRRRYTPPYEKIPPGIALITGSAVDESVNLNLGSKLAGNGLLPLEAVVEAAASSFNERWDREEVALTDEEIQLGLKVAKGNGYDRSVRLARLHATDFAPAIEPTHLQRKIVIPLPGYPYDLLGYLDIQEGLRAIRDTKTGGKTPPKDIADRDDQLTMYAMMVKVADGAIPETLSLDYLIDLKTAPVARSFVSNRTEDDFDPILRRIEAASIALEKGAFIPARETDWWCSPRWCGFWDSCPYTKKNRRPNG